MDSFNCLVAVASTILSIVIDAALAAWLALTSKTLNEIAAGIVTRACSLTVAVNVVVWLVSGSVTVVCAFAIAAVDRSEERRVGKEWRCGWARYEWERDI